MDRMSTQFAEKITLGRSSLQVSPLGVGTNTWGTGAVAGPSLQSTFEAALDLGIDFFDTAEIYNSGNSERSLGQFLQSEKRAVQVASKFFPFPWRLRKRDLAAALCNSLERLGRERIDLYMIHFPVPPVPLETWMDALADAVVAGLVRAVGISNCDAAQTRRAHAALAKRGIPLASNQVEYSLLRRRAERQGLLDVCRELGVTLVAYRPLSSGLLSASFSPDNRPAFIRGRYYSRNYLRRISPLVKKVGEIAAAHGKTVSQVALNWVICKGALPIPGAKSPGHLAENAGALGWRLSPGELADLDRLSERL
jgi:aryl-alcohol dehydrogenase-like predicted oxidoreductase